MEQQLGCRDSGSSGGHGIDEADGLRVSGSGNFSVRTGTGHGGCQRVPNCKVAPRSQPVIERAMGNPLMTSGVNKDARTEQQTCSVVLGLGWVWLADVDDALDLGRRLKLDKVRSTNAGLFDHAGSPRSPSAAAHAQAD